MCDYSLHNVASRPARVGDCLLTTEFPKTLTRGFCAVGEPEVAVCLRPGTEIAFDTEVQRHFTALQRLFFRAERWTIHHKVGRFRQINVNDPATHHDAIEFPDGTVMLVTKLRAGQEATVLQLPADPTAHDKAHDTTPLTEPRRSPSAA